MSHSQLTIPNSPFTIPPALPGPNGWEMLRMVRGLRDNPLPHLQQAQQQYGDVVRLPVGRRQMVLVNDPELVKHILQDNNRNYTKRGEQIQAKTVVGNGLLASEGEFWRRQRRLAQPAFHRQRIAAFGEVMVDETVQLLAGWQHGRQLDIAQEMMNLTLSIVTRTLFSATLDTAEMATVASAMPYLLRHTRPRIVRPRALRWRLPLPSNRTYWRHVAALDEIIYRLIAERRRTAADHPDLLGLLLAARDEETGEGMSDQQLRDEAMTIFLAGHETTANLLAWAWVVLGQQAAVRQRVREEVTTVLGGRLPTTADVPALPYTNQVIQEVLRLYPPAWIIMRTATADDQLGDYHLSAGTSVLISPYLLHHHPHLWHNPTSFDPERPRPAHKFAFLPFGAGPRICIGNQFALMEATLIMATIIQQYDLHLVPNHPIELETAITLRPKHGVQVVLSAE